MTDGVERRLQAIDNNSAVANRIHVVGIEREHRFPSERPLRLVQLEPEVAVEEEILSKETDLVVPFFVDTEAVVVFDIKTEAGVELITEADHKIVRFTVLYCEANDLRDFLTASLADSFLFDESFPAPEAAIEHSA